LESLNNIILTPNNLHVLLDDTMLNFDLPDKNRTSIIK